MAVVTPLSSETAPEDLIAVAKIAGAYGILGWLKLAPFVAAQESILLSVPQWWVQGRNGLFRLAVASCRAHGASIIASAPHQVPTREAAEALKGAQVLVSRALFPASESDEFYWVDLVGCQVANPAGLALGRVTEVADHGGHAVLILAAEGGTEMLIPFVARYIESVDIKSRRIVADWDPEY